MDWKKVTAVFLDMDGTILDLNFDNYFWHEHVPLRYSEKNKLNLNDAKKLLRSQYNSKIGTLEWYCLDYWTNELDLDIAALKKEISHQIKIFPNVKKFLKQLRVANKYTALITNAHRTSVQIKFDFLNLRDYFDNIISSHDFGCPKESVMFWEKLMAAQPFIPENTLFIDDNLKVLMAAEEYGIKNLVTIKQPDSSLPEQDTKHFRAITEFSEIMPT